MLERRPSRLASIAPRVLLVAVFFAFPLSFVGANCQPGPAATAALSTVPADAEELQCEAAIIEANPTNTAAGWLAILAQSLQQCTQDAIQIVNDIDGQVVQRMVAGSIPVADANAMLAAVHAQAKLPPPKLLALPAAKRSR